MVKKLLFSSGLIAAAVSAQAQITITSLDVAGIGKQIKQAHDTMPTVTPGPAGANVTWNFSALNNHWLDTLTFTNPSWTQWGNQFPSSNLAVVLGSQGTAYTTLSSGSFDIIGQAGQFGSTTVVIDVNPVETFVTFPSTFNTSFNNTTGYDEKFPFTQQPGIDSIRIKHNAVKTSVVNAWGTVTTPLLSNQACLRQRNYIVNTDTVWAHVIFPPGWQEISNTKDSLVHFTWWANGIGFPLVEMDSMMDGTITNVSWLQATPTNSGINEQGMISTVAVYPNPSADNISFDLRDANGEYIIVNDLAGREIARFVITREIETISISGFADGAYLFHVTDGSGRFIGRGKFNVVK